jgi:putative molybdopterin biosynthesis protein
MASSGSPGLLTVPQAAKFLNISERSLYRLVSADELPAYRVGRQLRFDEQELRGYMRVPGSAA